MTDRHDEPDDPRVIPYGTDPPLTPRQTRPTPATLITLIVIVVVGVGVAATTAPSRSIEWSEGVAPQNHLNALSVIDTPTGFTVLGGPRPSGGVVWSSTNGVDWIPRTLPRLATRIVLHDRGLYVVDRRSVTRIGPDGDDPIAVIDIPGSLRTGSGSGRVGLVAAFEGLLAQTVAGDLYWSPDGRRFRPAVDAAAWGADSDVTPPPSAVSDIAAGRVRSACDPQARVAPDVPPIAVTPNRIVALVPEDDPSVVWPVCEPVVWRSFDGAAWEQLVESSPFPDASYVYDFAWRDGRFIAVGGIGFDNAKVWTSVDATTWVEIGELDPPADVDVTTVDAGPLGWVITGTPHDRSSTVAWYSTDGACWEPVPEGVAAPAVAVGDEHVLFVDDEPARISVGTPTSPIWPIRRCL